MISPLESRAILVTVRSQLAPPQKHIVTSHRQKYLLVGLKEELRKKNPHVSTTVVEQLRLRGLSSQENVGLREIFRVLRDEKMRENSGILSKVGFFLFVYLDICDKTLQFCLDKLKVTYFEN